MFGMPIPNDSHEFLVFLLDNFHEALRKPVVQDSEVATGQTMTQLAHAGWQSFLKAGGHSPVIDLFFGMMRRTIECNVCKNCTYQWETFNILKIPCEGETFMEWIQNECAPTDLEGYACEKCSPTKQKATIHTHLWKLPQIVYIALRRFTPNFQKNTKNCTYAGEKISFTEFFAEQSEEPSKNWTYEIRGTVDHHGSHMGGHYVSQIRHPFSGEWWIIDDNNTHKLNKPMFGASTYLLMFRRVT
jgi:ubiquitin C-terminal hydrolase